MRYAWQQEVVDAFLAPLREVPAKVSVAEQAIAARLRERVELDSAENMALEDARRMLKVLISETRMESAEKRRAENRDQETGLGFSRVA